ncbi:hypothetical protein TNCV_247981 [Trichonephila clavipes]|nr:hypothetical protein TNCV_247981 [Trichonephila clavipes]
MVKCRLRKLRGHLLSKVPHHSIQLSAIKHIEGGLRASTDFMYIAPFKWWIIDSIWTRTCESAMPVTYPLLGLRDYSA